MAKKESYEMRTESLLQPIIESQAFELVDVEYVKEGGNWFLRVYIDKPGGITIEDCVLVSREASILLDQEDFIEETYTFEVSSPGLMRPLKKDKDFTRSIGKLIEVRTYRMINHQKEFVGKLISFDTGGFEIELEDLSHMTFEKTNVALVRQAFEE